MPISLEVVFFGILAGIGVILALMMLTVKSPVHAALCLVGVMATLAVHYIMMHAYFLGVVQIVVYAGAIMVLFLFVIMFFYAPGDRGEPGGMGVHFTHYAGATLVAIVFLAVVIGAMQASGHIDLIGTPEGAQMRDYSTLTWIGPVKTTSEDALAEFEESNPVLIGKMLFAKNLLPFEITGFLLLAAMLGAFVLAKRSPGKDRESAGGNGDA